jgi:hypothetical protein
MLADESERRAGLPLGAGRRRWTRRSRTEVLWRTLTSLVAAGVVVAYALPGGAYDIVVRQEYGLVVWGAVAVGLAVGLLPRARPSRAVLIVLGALLAYTAWVALSLAWTESAERTTAEVARGLDYLGLCMLVALTVDRHLWRPALAGIATGAIVVCGLSVGSRLFPTAFPPNAVGITFQTDRLSYPFGYWNAVAAWGAMTIAIGLAWGANDGSRLRRAVFLGGVPLAATMTYLSYSRAGVAGAGLAGVAVLVVSRHRWTVLIECLIAGVGVALTIVTIRANPEVAHGTGTRGAGAVFAVLVFACALSAISGWGTARLGTDRLRIPKRWLRPLALGCGVVALLVAAAFGPHLVSRAWHEFRNPTLPSAASNPTQRLTTLSGTRYNLWAVALDAFEAHPLTGTGAGTYEFVWNRHQRDPEFVLNAHSIWFETMAELGVPGLIAMLAFVGTGVALLILVRRRSLRRTSAAASTAALAAFMVFVLHASVDWMWQSTAITILALGGLMSAGSRLSKDRPVVRWWLRGALAALAVAAAAVQVPGLVSTLEIRRSQTAESQGQAAEALAWARAAVSAEPWAASPYDQEALVLESAGHLAAAATDLRRAIANEPTNYVHWLLLSRVETERGMLAQASGDYVHAHSLRTMGAVFKQP